MKPTRLLLVVAADSSKGPFTVMPIDEHFLQIARKAFDPYVPSSGTELMAPFLYSLVRMVRPMTLVESGSGYTTLFLLRALSDNIVEFDEERRLLREKSLKLGNLKARFSSVDPEKVKQWYLSGGKAMGVEPGYYLHQYRPHLYSFERLAINDPYVRRLEQAVNDIGHAEIFTSILGKSVSPRYVPARPIDLAWNDYDQYELFFKRFWPALNPRGGLFIFHNVPGAEAFWNSIEWMKQQRANVGDLEVLILHEPHKLRQNGCAVLRRTTKYHPPFAFANPAAIYERLKKFMRIKINKPRSR